MTPTKLITGWFVALLAGACLHAAPAPASSGSPGIKKIEDITIYQNEDFYCSFPSIVRRPNGELLVAFRRAPNRRKFGEGRYSHSDPNSQLVSVRSKDSGKTWSQEPQLIYAHPFGGSQDPCLVQLRDNSILCTSYGWALLDPKQVENLKQPVSANGRFVFLGGFILRSVDGGHSWQPPIIPAATQGETNLDIFGQPLPARSRGAICEGADGKLYWAAQTTIAVSPSSRKSEVHLMVSEDKGLTWKDSAVIAQDPKIGFNETSLYETPKGDLIAFMRTFNFDGRIAVARSTDKGKTFTWEDAGFQGHPSHAIRLPDKRVLLVYGYRHEPYGVRARVLDAECTNIASAPEVILRDDGGTVDLGYPWATMISKKRALVVYYFNKGDGLRTIESTLVEIL